MKTLMKIAAAGMIVFAGIAGTAIADGDEEAKNPAVKARREAMEAIGGATKVLGEMAGEKTAFDAAAAEAAKASMLAAIANVPTLFEANETDPVSEAKPEIWTNWDDFAKKAETLNAAVTAMDTASLDGVKAGMGAVGGACKDCHTSYRIMKE